MEEADDDDEAAPGDAAAVDGEADMAAEGEVGVEEDIIGPIGSGLNGPPPPLPPFKMPTPPPPPPPPWAAAAAAAAAAATAKEPLPPGGRSVPTVMGAAWRGERGERMRWRMK